MTPEIPPALTPDEYEHGVRRLGFEAYRAQDGAGLEMSVGVESGAEDSYVVYRRLDQLPALIAIANHALPDDDPHKLTQADVDALSKFEEYLGVLWDDVERGDEGDPVSAGDEYFAVKKVVAKIRALLPPRA
jgi:hypothetical protein